MCKLLKSKYCHVSSSTQSTQMTTNSVYLLHSRIVQVLHLRMFDFILRYPFFFQYSQLAKRQAIALKVLHDFTDKVIFRRRQQLLNKGLINNNQMNEDNDYVDIGIKKKQAFLDLLLQSSVNDQSLTDLEIREEVDTFMFEVSHFSFILGVGRHISRGMAAIFFRSEYFCWGFLSWDEALVV